MADDNGAAGAHARSDDERNALPRPLKRWRVVVRGTAAALVKESPWNDLSDGLGRAPSRKGRLSEQRPTP
jgi:hypothetical protein